MPETTGVLDMTLGELRVAIATGDHDAHLLELDVAERAGKHRKGALDAIGARIRAVQGAPSGDSGAPLASAPTPAEGPTPPAASAQEPEPPAPVVEGADPRLVDALVAAKRGVAAAIAAIRAERGLPPGDDVPPELRDVFDASADAADLHVERPISYSDRAGEIREAATPERVPGESSVAEIAPPESEPIPEPAPPRCVRALRSADIKRPDGRPWFVGFRDIYTGEEAAFLWAHQRRLVEPFPRAPE